MNKTFLVFCNVCRYVNGTIRAENATQAVEQCRTEHLAYAKEKDKVDCPGKLHVR